MYACSYTVRCAMTAATVKLLPLLKVTPKRRDMKELWLAAAIFGSLAPLALYLPQLGDFCLAAAAAHWLASVGQENGRTDGRTDGRKNNVCVHCSFITSEKRTHLEETTTKESASCNDFGFLCCRATLAASIKVASVASALKSRINIQGERYWIPNKRLSRN